MVIIAAPGRNLICAPPNWPGAFAKAGLKADSKIGHYLYNSNEYMEAHFASFKMRASPINVNYRYLEEELIYLLDNSDAEAVLFHGRLAERIANVAKKLPKLKLLIQVDDGQSPIIDGAIEYEKFLASNNPMPRIERSEDDIYMLYTGGTTGMPKGVMYRQGDHCYGLMMGYDFRGLPRPATNEEMISHDPQAGRRERAAGFYSGLSADAWHWHLGGRVCAADDWRLRCHHPQY